MNRIKGPALALALFFLAVGIRAHAQAASQPADETGTVTGTVYDSQTAAPIRGASVEAVAVGLTVRTDIDGRYTLKLPPGTYKLRVFAEGYFDQPIEGVVVAVRKSQFIDPVLVPKTMLSERVEVTADSVKAATAKSVMLERKLAQTIIDNVSAEDISRNPDSDAAGVMERVTGVSVMQDKYVFVRGLGERYSSTMLNGSLLPSTEPERKVVPFDLFPAALINKISTLKSFSPDQPGDFSGGLVKVETSEFPSEFTLKYSASVGFDTNVTSKTLLKYTGSHRDWLGAGYESRKLPESIPDERVTRKNVVTGSGFGPEELQTYGRSLRNQWSPEESKASPNFSQSFTGGGSYKKLGTVFSLTYSRKFQHNLEEVNSYQTLGGELYPYNLFVNDRNTETVKLGFVGNLAYKFSDNHKLLLKNFYARDASDEVRVLQGYSEGNTADERDTRLRYIQESIVSTQASGEHYFKGLGNSLLEWRLAYSRAERKEPDMRETIYRSEEGKNDYSFSSQGQSGFRQYSDQYDRIYEPGVDWSFLLVRGPIVTNFKLGALYQHRTRDFGSRRFVFLPYGNSGIDLRQRPEEIFSYYHINPNQVELREITRTTDTYDAVQHIYAGYGMADVTLGKRWRFIGGVRFEDSRQHLRTYDPFAPNLEPILTDLNNTDPLPSISAVYMLRPNMNIRAGYSRTVNRPEFREMAPFQFTDISGRSTTYGNPDLKQSKIDNADARWEWFRSEGDMYAASLFMKRFENPIERVLYYSADLLTSYYNTERANNRGIEVELRKNLGFMGGALSNWSLNTNYSRIFSEVSIGEIPGLVLTSSQRPLQGQADNIFNSVLEFTQPRWGTDMRFLYNYVGRRIVDVGATLLPDIYEQPNHFLDFSFSKKFGGQERWQLKFAAQNLLNRPITHLQSDSVYFRYRMGRQFSLGISCDIY